MGVLCDGCFPHLPAVGLAVGGAAVRRRGQVYSPFGRVTKPGEIAAAVPCLASPGAEWVSGVVPGVSGALSLLPALMRRPIAGAWPAAGQMAASAAIGPGR